MSRNFKNLVSSLLEADYRAPEKVTVYHGTVMAKAVRFLSSGVTPPTSTVSKATKDLIAPYYKQAVDFAIGFGASPELFPEEPPRGLLLDFEDYYLSGVRKSNSSVTDETDRGVYVALDFESAAEYARNLVGFGSELHAELAKAAVYWVKQVVSDNMGQDAVNSMYFFFDSLARYDDEDGKPVVLTIDAPFSALEAPRLGGLTGGDLAQHIDNWGHVTELTITSPLPATSIRKVTKI